MVCSLKGSCAQRVPLRVCLPTFPCRKVGSSPFEHLVAKCNSFLPVCEFTVLGFRGLGLLVARRYVGSNKRRAAREPITRA